MLDNPTLQFDKWFEEESGNDGYDPTAMALSTVDEANQADCRIVLLKGRSSKGFRFFTNYESIKSRQLNRNANACLVFYWPKNYRQIRIKGVVEKLSQQDSQQYFASRERESQLSAWASPQSVVMSSRDALEQRKQQIAGKFSDQEVPCPRFWGGWVLVPNYFEFWQGRGARFHDRHQYIDEHGRWTLRRLAP